MPADLIVLAVAENASGGLCYVDTKSLVSERERGGGEGPCDIHNCETACRTLLV